MPSPRRPDIHPRPGAHRSEPGRRHAWIPDDIFDAALRVFEERGIQDTTVDDIAASAGIAQGTFFNYFRSKDEFLQGMVRNGLERLCDDIRHKVDVDASSPVKIRQLVDAHLDFYLQRNGYLQMMQQVGHLAGRKTRDPIANEFQRYVNFLSHLIGRTNGTPPRGVAAIFAGMLTGSLTYLLSLRSNKERQAWRAYIHDRITHMLLPRR
jgi:AcrR family transcriptional regulator